jgi:hypothetical protein
MSAAAYLRKNRIAFQEASRDNQRHWYFSPAGIRLPQAWHCALAAHLTGRTLDVSAGQLPLTVTWGVPGLRWVAYGLNRVAVAAFLGLDGLIGFQRLDPTTLTLVARKPGARGAAAPFAVRPPARPADVPARTTAVEHFPDERFPRERGRLRARSVRNEHRRVALPDVRNVERR